MTHTNTFAQLLPTRPSRSLRLKGVFGDQLIECELRAFEVVDLKPTVRALDDGVNIA